VPVALKCRWLGALWQDVERQLGDVERRRMELKSLLEPDGSSRDD